jgi:hypothetical protein
MSTPDRAWLWQSLRAHRVRDVEENWRILGDIVVLQLPLSEGVNWLQLINYVAQDRRTAVGVGNYVNYLGMKRAPAAKVNHHAFEGGLVCHMLEMWELWQTFAGAFCGEVVDNAKVIKGIILHDLHKGFETFVEQKLDVWDCKYVKNDQDNLLTDDNKTLHIVTISGSGVVLTVEETHVVLNSHGGFSKTRTGNETPLAKLVYILDELSGNVWNKVDAAERKVSLD